MEPRARPDAASAPAARAATGGLTTADARARLDFLAELGYGFLESGQTGGQTERELRACGRSLGLSRMEFNSTGRLVLLEAALPDGGSVSLSGAARALDLIDCTRAKALSDLAAEVTREVAADGAERSAARDPRPSCTAQRALLEAASAEVRRLRDTATPWWAVALGMTMLAFCISMQVGVTWRAWVSAAVVQLVSSMVGAGIARARPPRLFAIAVQSSAAGAFATLLVQLGFVDPVGAAAAIAVNWLLLLPLPQMIGAVADAIEADFLSALTRVASVGMAALGIFIGGAVTFTLGELLGMEHPRLDSLPSFPWYLVLVFSALGAVANAFANGGRLPLVLPAAALGLLTAAGSQALLHVVGLPALWASSIAAVLLGVLSSAISTRTGYPQPVLALMGVTGALLPGIPVFFGILQEMGEGSGLSYFGEAAAICLGIGTGVALGVYLASLFRLTGRIR